MSLIFAAVCGYLAILVLVFVFQRSLMYPASDQRPDLARAEVGGFQIVTTQTADGLRLEHWYRPAADDARPVVVVFHGNAGHVGDRVSKLAFLVEQGFGLFLAEYRGYGGNPGRPNETEMTEDSRGVLDWLAGQGIGGRRLVLYGESLGTGLAVKLASERSVGAVVLEAPYTSTAAVAQAHYWYLPARWLTLDRWNVEPLVSGIGAPLLVLHGERDRTIPSRFGRALFAAAREPKQALFLPAADHNDLLDHPEARAAVLQAVGQVTRPKQPAH